MNSEKSLSAGKKVIFSAFATLLFFLFLELFLRISGLGSGVYLQVVPEGGPSDPSFYQPAENRLYKLLPDSQGQYKNRLGESNPYRINNLGFRGPDISGEKPENVYRIICLGDSCTFGEGLGGDTVPYPRILENILNESARGVRFEVVNAGVPGYNTIDGFYWIRDELMTLSPDLVTILFGWNDHWLTDRPPYEEAAKNSRVVRLHDILHKLNIYRLLSRMIYRLRWKSHQERLMIEFENSRFEVLPHEYQTNLSGMRSMVKSGGADVILMTSPSGIMPGHEPAYLLKLGVINNLETLPALHETYNNVVRKTARENGVLLVDPAKAFKGREDEFFDDRLVDPIHPNYAGHQFIARMLAEAVLKNSFSRF